MHDSYIEKVKKCGPVYAPVSHLLSAVLFIVGPKWPINGLQNGLQKRCHIVFLVGY
jgi:hypothetical protein